MEKDMEKERVAELIEKMVEDYRNGIKQAMTDYYRFKQMRRFFYEVCHDGVSDELFEIYFDETGEEPYSGYFEDLKDKE